MLNRIDRHRVKQQADWMRVGPADMIGYELAHANFDFDHHVPNYTRWAEINAKVLESLAQLERDFA